MCSIFFDIASAFDKVWHNGLIYKLIKIKFPNHIISWIKEFLNNRLLSVRVNNTVTPKMEIKAGVPQGAVLSPKLFSIFINDLPIKYNKNKLYSLLFADDLCAYKIFKKNGNVNKQIQAYLNWIEKWLTQWRLMMAPLKCSYIVFSSERNNETAINLKLFNEPIKICSETSFLGIRFDKHLSFKNQFNYIKEECGKRMNILKIIANKSWGLSSKTLIIVYNSLIRSVIDSSIIYPALSPTNIQFLESIQLQCFKIIQRKSKYESNESIKKEINGYESLADRFDKLNIRYVKQAFTNKADIIIDLFQEYKEFSDSRVLKRKPYFANIKMK